jgi:hypothetical protein
MSERASRARQRRGPGSPRDRGAIPWGAGAGSLRDRGAISWGAGVERATDEWGPCEIAERFRGVHVRLREEVIR